MESRGVRKVRSDKKRDVKPTIPINLKRSIERLAYLLDLPIKDTAEELCRRGIFTKRVMEHLSKYFKRDVRLENTIYYGFEDTPRVPYYNVRRERITIKFKQANYDAVCLLAYTLDENPSRTTGNLLNASIRDLKIVETMIREREDEIDIDDEWNIKLKKLMKYINVDNPYETRITLGTVLKDIAIGLPDFVVNGWRKE